MPNAKLKINEFGQEPLEIEIKSGLITLGRAPDNAVALVSDSNVSRYHAEIERRGDNFYLVDLNSRNGTFVNDEPIEGERRLQEGDKISLGGDDSIVEILFDDQIKPGAELGTQNADLTPNLQGGSLDAAGLVNQTVNPQSAIRNPQSNIPLMLTIAAVLSGLAIIAVIGVVLFLSIPTSCAGEVVISSPESGVTISETTPIQVSAKNAKCIERVSYRLDGKEFASAEVAPYKAELKPEIFPDLMDDEATHVLSVAVTGKDGVAKIQESEILIAFSGEDGEKSKDETKSDKTLNDANNDEPESPVEKPVQISLAETKEMCERLMKFYGNSVYRYDAQFLKQVQARTAEYKAEGFSTRAAAARDAINIAFFNEQGLPAPLGYHLAMSRSRFENKRGAAAKEGLWQMTDAFASANGYNGQCGTENLSAAGQNCAARVAAVYAKALVTNLFEGDVVYGIACFDLSLSEAGNFKNSLPAADRADFWNVIKSAKQRDQLARFFAAGIVAENPQKFGLKRDKPLFNLYQNLLGQ
ncbi:MAG TPA: FHA domain-containing protein [Pyrinomonadaceae bacterium]|jgi:pSer/pThr/pTyr-binding forkhead associated (FHA) protein